MMHDPKIQEMIMDSSARTWQCPKGHITHGPAFTMTAFAPSLSMHDEKVADSGPLCPICYVEWMSTTFPTKEAT